MLIFSLSFSGGAIWNVSLNIFFLSLSLSLIQLWLTTKNVRLVLNDTKGFRRTLELAMYLMNTPPRFLTILDHMCRTIGNYLGENRQGEKRELYLSFGYSSSSCFRHKENISKYVNSEWFTCPLCIV